MKSTLLSHRKIDNKTIAGNKMQAGILLQGDLVCFGEQVTNQEQLFPQTYLNDFAKKAKK